MTEPNLRAATNRLISLIKCTSGKFLEAEIMATLADIYGRGLDNGEKRATIGTHHLPSGRVIKFKGKTNG